MKSVSGWEVPVYFLDTDIEGNLPEDREITSLLYGGDERYRIKQEIVLGIGGVRMLEKLNILAHKYRMNEGHSSFLALELLRKFEMDINKSETYACSLRTHRLKLGTINSHTSLLKKL